MGPLPAIAAAALAAGLLSACAGSPDRDHHHHHDEAKQLDALDQERARREAYEQGHRDAQRRQRGVPQTPSLPRLEPPGVGL